MKRLHGTRAPAVPVTPPERPVIPPVLVQLTKPAYLLVRLLATPTNHRAPPS